jgi:hypothetical protein
MALYGFHNLNDVQNARITGSLIEAVNDAITAASDEHNRTINALTGLFAEETTDYTMRFAQGGNTRLQPLDEHGRALPVKPSGYYDTAYPIQMAGSAWGATYVTRAKMTVRDAERATAMMLDADARWMRDHILAALFADASYTFTDDLYGSLTVQGIANNDSVTYTTINGADSGATDDHTLAQAAAIADATNPFPTIYDELDEHPENSGPYIAFIGNGLRATTEALATFHESPDANLQRGANDDVLVGDLGIDVPGRVLGYEESGMWVVEWRGMPANYIIGVAAGGAKPLRMRQDMEAELQGFKRVAQRDDHPFYESQWMRRAGFGAWNRVGAVAYRVSNGTYAVPTGYSLPMP